MTRTDEQNITHHYSDVVIVGAGPIGLSMCRALKGADLSVTLIEKQPQEAIANPLYDGREIAITHRTRAIMQDLQQWQLLDKAHIHHLKRAQVFNGTSSFALGFDKPEYINGRPIETLGYLLANYRIRKAAFDALTDEWQDPSYVQAWFDSTITDVDEQGGLPKVRLDDGRVVVCKLLIAADSRMSLMRRLMGVGASMNDFGRTVLVFATTHTKSNHNTAHEGFYYGKTLAVLPLGEYASSMVITVDNSKVDELKRMDDKALAAEMTAWLGGALGQMTVDSQVFSYPLMGVHAKKFYGHRFALIGDAAVGMHPVTAHGYNLGMESVHILSQNILQAAQKGEDIGANSLLRRYHLKHSAKTRPMYHGTNAIVGLYTDERAPAKLMRHAGLRIGQHLLPIKKLITNQLTG